MTSDTSLQTLANNPSCMDDYDPNAMHVAKAREYIQQFLNPVSEAETLALRDSLGRVLAADITSPANVPNYDNSAMDGYALKASDLATPRLKVVGTAFAGKAFNGTVSDGQCVRIMTGAAMPAGTDTVVVQEKTVTDGEFINISEAPKPQANVRYAGEDLKLGQSVLTKGHLMRPADLGLIASLGIAEVQAYRKLKVAFFSTGDELVGLGQPLQTGQVYDSNRYTLFGMLTRLGVEVN